MESIYSKDSYGATHAFNLDKVVNTLEMKHFPSQSHLSGSNLMTGTKQTPEHKLHLTVINNKPSN
jgi:hypothetical protein